jgi:hypothetical protein
VLFEELCSIALRTSNGCCSAMAMCLQSPIIAHVFQQCQTGLKKKAPSGIDGYA